MKPKLRPCSLRRYRKLSGLQQKEVAKLLGLRSTAIISRWETGKVYPDLTNAFKLAVAYNVLVDALFIDLRRGLIEDAGEKVAKK